MRSIYIGIYMYICIYTYIDVYTVASQERCGCCVALSTVNLMSMKDPIKRINPTTRALLVYMWGFLSDLGMTRTSKMQFQHLIRSSNHSGIVVLLSRLSGLFRSRWFDSGRLPVASR